MEAFDKFFVRFIGSVFTLLIFVIVLSMVTTHLEKVAAIEAGLVQAYDPEHDKLLWVLPRKEPGDAQADAE